MREREKERQKAKRKKEKKIKRCVESSKLRETNQKNFPIVLALKKNYHKAITSSFIIEKILEAQSV